MIVPIHNRKLLDSMCTQNMLRLFERCPFQPGDQILLCHKLADRAGFICLKLHVAVRNNADQYSVIVYNRYSGNPEFTAQGICITESIVSLERKRIGNNSVFRTLYHIYHFCLHINRKIFVNDTNTAFSGNSNSHTVFCNCVHGCTHHRYIQGYLVCQFGPQIYISWKNIALRRYQKDIVKRQSLPDKTIFINFLKAHGILLFNVFYLLYTKQGLFARKTQAGY